MSMKFISDGKNIINVNDGENINIGFLEKGIEDGYWWFRCSETAFTCKELVSIAKKLSDLNMEGKE